MSRQLSNLKILNKYPIKKWNLKAKVLALLFVVASFFQGCSGSSGVSGATGNTKNFNLPEMEARLKALEEKESNQALFIKQTKEILVGHRAHIVDLEKKLKIITEQRYRPK